MNSEAAVLLGVIVAQSLALYQRALPYRGYFWPAIRRTFGYLAIAVFVQWTIGLVILHAIPNSISPRGPFESVVVGLVIVLIPNLLDKISDQVLTFPAMRTWVVRILVQLKVSTGKRFVAEIVQLRRQDNFDCQHSLGSWNTRADEKHTGRQLRLLYESMKVEISNARRKPHLMRFDVDISPGQKFYLLVAYLGRNELRELMQHPPEFSGLTWKGDERRRKVGAITDRAAPDPNMGISRSSDNKHLLAQIAKGEACAEDGQILFANQNDNAG